jgi:hypothetical protein
MVSATSSQQIVINHRDNDDVGEDRRAHRGPVEELPGARLRRKPGQRQSERDENVGEDGEEAEIADGRFDEWRTGLGDGEAVLQDEGEPGHGGRADAVIFRHSPLPRSSSQVMRFAGHAQAASSHAQVGKARPRSPGMTLQVLAMENGIAEITSRSLATLP